MNWPLGGDYSLHYERILAVPIIFRPEIHSRISCLQIELQGGLIGLAKRKPHPVCAQTLLARRNCRHTFDHRTGPAQLTARSNLYPRKVRESQNP